MLGGDDWIIGRVSMEPYAGRAPLPRAHAAVIARAVQEGLTVQVRLTDRGVNSLLAAWRAGGAAHSPTV
jgi:hypothetical protein